MENHNNGQFINIQILLTQGLSEAEARDRLATYAPNELKNVQRFRLIRLILSQFTNMFLVLLIFAAGVSWLTGARTDALIIGGIVLINAMISFVQEYQAEQAIKVLQRMMRPVTQVICDDVLQKVFVRQVVPGDVVCVEAGDHVSADGIVGESVNGMVNESLFKEY